MSPKRRKVGADVDHTRRPRHLDPRGDGCIRKAEMEYRLVASEESIRETKLPSLPPQSDDGPETVAVARRPRETESNPVSRGARGEIEVWGAAEVVDDHVERAASVEIRNRGPTSEAVGNVLHRLRLAELPRPLPEKKLRALPVGFSDLPMLLELRIDMAVGDEQVEDSVVAHVEEGSPPAEARERRKGETRGCGHVLERETAVVSKEGVVVPLEVGDVEVEVAVGVVVGGGRAHAGLLHPEGAVAGAGHQGDILETEASEILEKKLHARVVGDPDLRKPVGVEVHEENGESACRRLLDQRFRHVAKSRAVRVSIERIRGARKAVGAAEDLDSKIVATGAEIDLRDVDIGTDVEVEEPVEIQIAESGPGAPRVVLRAGLGLDESPIAVVAKERVAAESSHIKIAVAVVVDIAHGAAERPAPVVDAGTSGDVVEREGPAPAIESAAARGVREIAIGEKKIPGPVVVEIEDADTGPHHVGDRRLPTAGGMVTVRDEGRKQAEGRNRGERGRGEEASSRRSEAHPKATVSAAGAP